MVDLAVSRGDSVAANVVDVWSGYEQQWNRVSARVAALADYPRVMLPIIFYNLVQHLIAGVVDKFVCRAQPRHARNGLGPLLRFPRAVERGSKAGYTSDGGWGRRPKGDASRSEASRKSLKSGLTPWTLGDNTEAPITCTFRHEWCDNRLGMLSISKGATDGPIRGESNPG